MDEVKNVNEAKRIMLLDSEEVGAYIFKKNTIFPNELFPIIPACVFRYLACGLAQEIPDDKPIELEEEVAAMVGKVELPPAVVEEKVEKPKEMKKPTVKSNYSSTGKRIKE